MSLKAAIRDHAIKAAVGLAFTAVVGGILWVRANVVWADDLTPLAEAIKALADDAKRDQDEWRCSELQEELDDFYSRQEAGEELSEREKDRMQTIKTRMGDGENGLSCARFED